MRERWSTVIPQRTKPRVGVDLIAWTSQKAVAIIAADVVAVRCDHAAVVEDVFSECAGVEDRVACRVEQKAEALVAHALDDNLLLGELLASDGAHVPFAFCELPKKAAVALGRDSYTVYEPFHVAAGCCGEFDHLL
jgi:hypothetical protein